MARLPRIRSPPYFAVTATLHRKGRGRISNEQIVNLKQRRPASNFPKLLPKAVNGPRGSTKLTFLLLTEKVHRNFVISVVAFGLKSAAGRALSRQFFAEYDRPAGG
jgi:hypothetical protein